MPFIEATRSDLVGKPIYINVDQIVSVSQPGNQTVIIVSAPGPEGTLAYVVEEPVGAIMDRIVKAQAHG